MLKKFVLINLNEIDYYNIKLSIANYSFGIYNNIIN